jgi:hypothetical protein
MIDGKPKLVFMLSGKVTGSILNHGVLSLRAAAWPENRCTINNSKNRRQTSCKRGRRIACGWQCADNFSPVFRNVLYWGRRNFCTSYIHNLKNYYTWKNHSWNNRIDRKPLICNCCSVIGLPRRNLSLTWISPWKDEGVRSTRAFSTNVSKSMLIEWNKFCLFWVGVWYWATKQPFCYNLELFINGKSSWFTTIWKERKIRVGHEHHAGKCSKLMSFLLGFSFVMSSNKRGKSWNRRSDYLCFT